MKPTWIENPERAWKPIRKDHYCDDDDVTPDSLREALVRSGKSYLDIFRKTFSQARQHRWWTPIQVMKSEIQYMSRIWRYFTIDIPEVGGIPRSAHC